MILLLSHSSSVKSVASNGSRSSGGTGEIPMGKVQSVYSNNKGGLVLKNYSNIRKDEHINVVVVLEKLFVLGLINEYEYSKALTLANRFSS